MRTPHAMLTGYAAHCLQRAQPATPPSAAPGLAGCANLLPALLLLFQVEGACAVEWFLGEECFEELKERSKDTRGVALPNFMSNEAFQIVFLNRECARSGALGCWEAGCGNRSDLQVVALRSQIVAASCMCIAASAVPPNSSCLMHARG